VEGTARLVAQPTLSEPTRRCCRCDQVRPWSDFSIRASTGRPRSDCKPCNAEVVKEWRRVHVSTTRKSDPSWNRKYQYGLTEADYEKMLVEADGRCQVCSRPFTKTPNVDHSHATGEVRGLLCGDCNRMLGLARDDVGLLLAAVAYLSRGRRAAA